MSEPTVTNHEDGRTSISIEIGPGALGVDARMKVEHTFTNTTGDPKYLDHAADALRQVFTVAFGKLDHIAAAARQRVDALPKGYVGVSDPRTAAAPVNTGQYAPVTTPTAQGIVAVANGAPIAQGASPMKRYPSRFGDEGYRALSIEAYPTEQLKAWALNTAAEMGLDPNKLEVWDERPNGERGQPIGSAANVKVKKDYDQDPLVGGNRKVVFRVHFDSTTHAPKAKLEAHWNTLISVGNLGQFALGAGSQAPAPVAAPAAPAQPQYPVQGGAPKEPNPFMDDPGPSEPEWEAPF